MKFSVILAATKEGGIGKDNGIPWKLKPDMAYFRGVTTSRDDPLHRKNAIVMGRKTWESIPAKFRPLPNRINVIVSSNRDLLEGNTNPDAFVVANLGEALSVLEKREDCARVFIGGGARLYTEALQSDLCETIHFTEIYDIIECDTFVSPKLLPPPGFKKREANTGGYVKDPESGITFDIMVFDRE